MQKDNGMEKTEPELALPPGAEWGTPKTTRGFAERDVVILFNTLPPGVDPSKLPKTIPTVEDRTVLSITKIMDIVEKMGKKPFGKADYWK